MLNLRTQVNIFALVNADHKKCGNSLKMADFSLKSVVQKDVFELVFS